MAIGEVSNLNAVPLVIHETPERYCTQPRRWVVIGRHRLGIPSMADERAQSSSMSWDDCQVLSSLSKRASAREFSCSKSTG